MYWLTKYTQTRTASAHSKESINNWHNTTTWKQSTYTDISLSPRRSGGGANGGAGLTGEKRALFFSLVSPTPWAPGAMANWLYNHKDINIIHLYCNDTVESCGHCKEATSKQPTKLSLVVKKFGSCVQGWPLSGFTVYIQSKKLLSWMLCK